MNLSRRELLRSVFGLVGASIVPAAVLSPTSVIADVAPTIAAIDKINVRRILDMIQESISEAMTHHLFEFNDEQTRSAIVSQASNYLNSISQVQDYHLVCNEMNNPPSVVNNNEIVLDVNVKLLNKPYGFTMTGSRPSVKFSDIT